MRHLPCPHTIERVASVDFAREHDGVGLHSPRQPPRKPDTTRFALIRHSLACNIPFHWALRDPNPESTIRPAFDAHLFPAERIGPNLRGNSMTLNFSRGASKVLASSLNPGAASTSRDVRLFRMARTVSASTGRLNATIPPNALTGSPASASSKAGTNPSKCSAPPQGIHMLQHNTTLDLRSQIPRATPHPYLPDC